MIGTVELIMNGGLVMLSLGGLAWWGYRSAHGLEKWLLSHLGNAESAAVDGQREKE